MFQAEMLTLSEHSPCVADQSKGQWAPKGDAVAAGNPQHPPLFNNRPPKQSVVRAFKQHCSDGFPACQCNAMNQASG